MTESPPFERKLFENRVQLSLDDLLHHGYVVGSSGTGKTVFLMNLLKSLVEKHGSEVNIQVIDPHGDLAWNKQEKESPDLAKVLPKVDQIILLDADIEFSLNPLQLPVHNRSDSREHSQVVSWQIDLLTNIFEEMFRVTELRAPRLMFILTSCLRYLYALRDDPTFIDFYDLLLKFNKKDEMAKILSALKIDRTEVMETIQFLADMHNKEMYMSVLNKVQQFATDTYLRQVFSARKRTVDFMELTKPGKVVLWRLGLSLTKAVKPALMAAIMMNIWAAVQYRERQLLPRTPIVCVVDEFQHLQWMNILKTILSEARKFRLGLILAHQNSEQVSDELLTAIWGNVWMKVVFSISGFDADRLAKNFDATRTKEVVARLTSIPAFSCDIQTKSRGKELRSPLTRINLAERLPPPKLVRSDADVQALIQRMRETYGGGIVEPSMFETFEVSSGDPYFRYPTLKPVEYLMLLVLSSYERLPYDSKWREDVATLVTAMKGYGFDRSRFPLAVDSLSRKGLVTSREEYLDYRERKVINGKVQAFVRPPQSEAEKNESRVMSYAVSRKARLDFFEDLPKGARGGGPLHTYLLNVALKKYRSSGYYCFVDTGDRHQKLPDIIAIPYTETEHDGIWRVDPDLWNQTGILAIEVEVWPGKHRDRVEHNYEKSAEKVRQVVFVTDSEYNREKIESSLRGMGASKCQTEMVQDIPAKVLLESQDESESDRGEDFPIEAEKVDETADDDDEEDKPRPIQLIGAPLKPLQYDALKTLKLEGSMSEDALVERLIAKGFTKSQVGKALGDFAISAYKGVSTGGDRSVLTPAGADLLDTMVEDGGGQKKLVNQVFTSLLNEEGVCPLIDRYDLPDHPEVILYRAARDKYPFNPEEWEGAPELLVVAVKPTEGICERVGKYKALGHRSRVITSSGDQATRIREALTRKDLDVPVEVFKLQLVEDKKPAEIACPLCATTFFPEGIAKCPGCGSLLES